MKRILVMVLGLFALSAVPAYAHVTVSSPNATPGGYATVIFKVPTESDTLSTTGLAVQLPAATPFASVSVQPVTGWKITTKTARLAKPITNDDGDQVSEYVSEIDWKAVPGAGIKPGEFQQFPVSLGAMPDAKSVTFRALQTYSDGSIVKWIEIAAPGAKTEPDHPAPTLTLTSADAPAPKAKSASTTGATVLSIVALVVAAAALGLGIVTRARKT